MSNPAYRSLLLDFLATRNPRKADAEAERIATPEALKTWLLRRELIQPGDQVLEADVANARRVRAAIRSFIAAHRGRNVDPRTAPTLSSVTSYAPLKLTVGDDGAVRLQPAVGGVAGALSSIVAELYLAAADGTLERLGICRMCGFPFHDRTRNRSRVWCSMERCGARAKSRALKARRQGDSRASNREGIPAETPGASD
jgi:predicted RNA-binding Zn ribbon-like protein